MQRRLFVLTFCALFASGCVAWIDHSPVPDKAADDQASGIRYYRASPYLLVYTNSKGGLKWQILYLPDQSEKMQAEPVVFGGRSELTMYFQNGVLSSTTEIGDTTALPKAIIAAIQSALPLLAKAAAFSAEKAQVPAPYLYKMVVKKGTIHFYGSQGDTSIIVPTLEAKAS